MDIPLEIGVFQGECAIVPLEIGVFLNENVESSL